jgi:deoxyuridine 5'-triphosphate nucleotidohydrolase
MRKNRLWYYTEKHPIQYGNEYAAGIDLPFYDPELPETITVKPGQRIMLKTGVHMEIPEGHVGLMDSRSSTSKLVVDLLCRTIDEDFRGNIRTVLVNVGEQPVELTQGNYYFQMVIVAVPKFELVTVEYPEDLSETLRGTQGFGSTGNTNVGGNI